MLLDTSAVLALVERGNDRLKERLRATTARPTRSMSVLGELRHGTAVPGGSTADDERRAASVAWYVRLTQVSPVDSDELSEWYGHVSGLATATGSRAGQNDRWVVAEALVNADTLVTCDTAQAKLMEDVIEAFDTRAHVDYIEQP